MRPRQILIAVGALVIVAVLLLVFGNRRTSSPGMGELVDQLVVPGFLPEQARLIEITKTGNDTVRVRKQGDHWTVETASGYEADVVHVAALLDTLETMRILEVRSTRPEGHREFGVDDAGGIWVRVYDGSNTELAAVCAGKATWYDRCFVRRAGSDLVFEARPSALYAAGVITTDRELDPVFFVDKKVLSFNPADVRALTLEREGETVVLAKVDVEQPGVDPDTGEATISIVTKWVIRQPTQEEADENACLETISGLSAMTATGIGGDRTRAECALDPPLGRVTVEFSEKSGTEPVTVLFGTTGPKRGSNYVVKVEEGARIFVVRSYYAHLVARDLGELRRVKPEAPAAEAGEAGEGNDTAESADTPLDPE